MRACSTSYVHGDTPTVESSSQNPDLYGRFGHGDAFQAPFGRATLDGQWLSWAAWVRDSYDVSESPMVMCLFPVTVTTISFDLLSLASSCSVTTRLDVDIYSNSKCATGVFEGRSRAHHAAAPVHRARNLLRRARELH